MKCHEIIPGLFLGSADAIGDESKKLGISTIVRVHTRAPTQQERAALSSSCSTYCWVVAHDHPHTLLRDVFERVSDYVASAHRRHSKVLVCGSWCSATLVASFLMSSMSLDADAALELINAKAPRGVHVQPNISGFLRQLRGASGEDGDDDFFPDPALDFYHFSPGVICVLRHSMRLDDPAVDGNWPDRPIRPYDTPLAANGAQLAEETMRRISIPFHRIVCSPFRRCLQTLAALHLQDLHVQVHHGVGEVMSRVRSEMRPFPDAKWQLLDNDAISAALGSDRWAFAGDHPQLDEPVNAARATQVLAGFGDTEENTLVVTHGDVINAATEGMCGRICYTAEYCACVVIDPQNNHVLFSSGCKLLL